jgi:serine/threonine protein kinase
MVSAISVTIGGTVYEPWCCASVTADVTAHTNDVPALSYMQLQGHKYTATVDIWSLGIITFVLMGGYPPFYDR